MDFIPQGLEAQRQVHASASLGWQKSQHCYCNVPARLGMGQAEASSELSLSCYPFLSLCTNSPPSPALFPCRR